MKNSHPFFKVGGQMKTYEENEHWFSPFGFSPEVAEKILRIASLSVWDAFWIFDEAKRIPDGGTYLEIGSDLGGSLLAAYLGTKFCKRSVGFIAIENNVRVELLINTRQIPSLEIINLDSEVAKSQIEKNSVDLLFIDGDHRQPFVKMDLENYWPKIKENGAILGHDYKRMEGVRTAMDEFFARKRQVEVLKDSDIWRVRK